MKYASILGDGNLLIGRNNEDQIEKGGKMINVGEVKVHKVVKVGEMRFNGCKGVIYGVPINVNSREIMENLRVKNGTV